jgi:hypothetical protein
MFATIRNPYNCLHLACFVIEETVSLSTRRLLRGIFICRVSVSLSALGSISSLIEWDWGHMGPRVIGPTDIADCTLVCLHLPVTAISLAYHPGSNQNIDKVCPEDALVRL